MHDLFSFSDSHRSAALDGQHRDRKPKEKAEERAHDSTIVPQTKNVHQGTGFLVFFPDEVIRFGTGQDAPNGVLVQILDEGAQTEPNAP
ncbi:hypothetical protein [Massilia sp. TN1-12]|uniref:hypothetical protein n=1 Tax=Massilia paldalensis TaxID=3377675 RepID=UPI00384BEF6F